MAVHVSVTSPRPRVLRLFRGDAPDRLAELLRGGVRARERPLAPDTPGLRALSLSGLPPDLVPDLASEVIYEHVLAGSGRSPFVSFSASEAVARSFALAGGRRHRGLLIQADVLVAVEHAVEAHPTWRYGSFADAAGRPWIRVDGCNVGADAILHGALVRHVQTLGRGDAEYLLLGSMAPSEFRFFWVEGHLVREVVR